MTTISAGETPSLVELSPLARHSLVCGVPARRSELWAFDRLPGLIVPEPRFAWLKAGSDRMASPMKVLGGMLAG